ncbi:MAG: hypothetical protein AVDCRST_MAG93-1673 [uncultured Chloroflexia bacterium]|uniref:Uncharacterized protein n=1 Tax=uncultured Chloroflexia bacterium TaxID=1672391 RepID=A0A6J4IF98_9CHLR|nr:MAG: hypothetical protein AVDCRST_MAG93-1673 [uncultured Chloroflexia bacterium]
MSIGVNGRYDAINALVASPVIRLREDEKAYCLACDREHMQCGCVRGTGRPSSTPPPRPQR